MALAFLKIQQNTIVSNLFYFLKTRYPTDLRFQYTLGALALISFGMILYEIILTRILAVLLSYHFVFAILSLAMFGLGIGGLVAKKWLKPGQRLYMSRGAAYTAWAVGLVTGFIFYLSQSTPASWGAFVTGAILFLPLVPFIFWGVTIALFFQQSPEQSSLLYGSDIAGGALAALAAVPLLNWIPATTAAFVVVLVLTIASSLLSIAEKPGRYTAFLSTGELLLALLGIWLAPQGILPLKNDQDKDINRMLYEAPGDSRIVETRWSAFGQTNMVENDHRPDEKMIYIDGAAGTSMFNYRGLLRDTTLTQDLTVNFGEYFPFLFLEENQRDSALIIGPGGGRDVLVAMLGKTKSITAVEVNPDLVQLVKDYEEFNGGLYTQIPNVEVVVDEGRSFLRNTSEKYDLIMLALPITKSSRSVNGYALTENYLFTVEAFGDYLDHLTPEGRIVFVTHADVELYRLLALTLKAFETRGISNKEAMKHIYTVAKHTMPTLIIRKKTFTPQETEIRHAALHSLKFDQGDYFLPFQDQITRRIPIPGDTVSTVEWNMFDQPLVGLAEGTLDLDDLIEAASVNIAPVYDDNPFFYNFTKSLSSPFRQLFGLILLGGLVVLMILLVNKPAEQVKLWFIRTYAQHRALKVFLVLFLLLGMGFMMLEIAFFQKLTLYVGSPTLATSILLSSLLFGAGMGSLTSILVQKRFTTAISLAGIAVFALGILYLYLLNDLLAAALSVSVYLRAGLLMGVLGFAMGFCFPLSIRLMKQYGLKEFTSSMWGANGLASVAGSVLGMIIGIEWGFTEVVVAGSSLYLAAALLALMLKLNQSFKNGLT